jgi:hypothetical protein
MALLAALGSLPASAQRGGGGGGGFRGGASKGASIARLSALASIAASLGRASASIVASSITAFLGLASLLVHASLSGRASPRRRRGGGGRHRRLGGVGHRRLGRGLPPGEDLLSWRRCMLIVTRLAGLPRQGQDCRMPVTAGRINQTIGRLATCWAGAWLPHEPAPLIVFADAALNSTRAYSAS